MATASWDVADISIAVSQGAWDVASLGFAVHRLVTVTADTEMAEPLETVTLTAAAVGPSTIGSSWTWRVVPTPGDAPVVLNSTTGSSITFTAPALQSAGQVTIGATGTENGVQTSEGIIVVPIAPHLLWRATSSGWVADDLLPI